VYLTHHLGLADAKAFISRSISASRAQYLLEQQVRVKPAEKWAKDNGDDYIAGHRAWLNQFVNTRITMSYATCPDKSVPSTRDLVVVCDDLAKQKKEKK